MSFKLYSKDQDLAETVFAAAMYWRIAYGGVRVFLGYKLLSLVGLPAVEVYQRLLRREVFESNDFILQGIGRMLVHHGFSITYFITAYFLFWGVMDIILSVCMLRHYLWAFPVSIALMGLFIAYELFRFTHTHSPVLFGFIIIDLFLIYLVFSERDKLVARIERKNAQALAL